MNVTIPTKILVIIENREFKSFIFKKDTNSEIFTDKYSIFNALPNYPFPEMERHVKISLFNVLKNALQADMNNLLKNMDSKGNLLFEATIFSTSILKNLTGNNIIPLIKETYTTIRINVDTKNSAVYDYSTFYIDESNNVRIHETKEFLEKRNLYEKKFSHVIFLDPVNIYGVSCYTSQKRLGVLLERLEPKKIDFGATIISSAYNKEYLLCYTLYDFKLYNLLKEVIILETGVKNYDLLNNQVSNNVK